ncbi:MAG: hypothetical protein CVU44_14705 [Chloroflexi bacterium HGW-Chloroflexi-6]|nr:MAG: hypothetical protein CVU44_14705 [Chloroflexi bacterium HGW-Chloroflexi-6]
MDANTYQVRLYYENDAASPNETANRTAIEAYFDGDSNTDDLLTSSGTDQPTYVYWNAAVNTSSTSFLTADFGFGPLGKFGDTVYWDANNNGDQDYSESGVQNALVMLYTFTDAGNNNGSWNAGEGFLNEDGSVDGLGNPTYTAGEPFYDVPDGKYQPGEVIANTAYAVDVTDADGKYLFTGLPSGNYVAVVNTTSATIDHDQNSGTANIANPLYNANLTGDPDTDGIACDKLNSPADLYETDENFCDNRMGMQIFPGTNYMGADFGYLPSGVIGDTLWIDSTLTDHDNDPLTPSIYGIRDVGEAGIPNITVTATTTPPNNAVVNGVTYNGSTQLVLSATTDINGNYSFQNITTSVQLTWTVAVATGELPAGLSNTYDPDAGNNNQTTVIMNVDGSINSVGGCTTSNGCDNESDPLQLDVDFGYRYTGTLDVSGTICLEKTSADGFCGTGAKSDDSTGVTTSEVAYDGITVYLLRWTDAGSTPNGSPDPGETVLVASTSTDAGGNYIFNDVPQSPSSGTSIYYIVALTAPQDGVVLTTDSTNVTTDVPDEAVDAYPANNAFLGVSTASDGDTLSVFMVVEADYGTTAIDGADFAFQLNGSYDFGDLPQGVISGTTYKYSTTLSGTPDGPRHALPSIGSPILYLGGGVNADADGYSTSVSATLDSSDNGVTLGSDSNWQDGNGSLYIVVTTPASGGYLVGWVDFNNDGDFGDANEVVVNRVAAGGLTQSTLEITFPTPYNSTYRPNFTGLYSRFRLFPTSPVVPQLAYTGPADNGEVEDYRLSGMTTPITLAYFRAQRQGGLVNFEWTTATETVNAGFNLYVESKENGLTQINPELILSQVIDSLEPQDYTFSANIEGNVFFIEDVSIAGETRLHGPFPLGQPSGERIETEKVNWSDFKSQKDSAQADRLKALKPELALSATTQAKLKKGDVSGLRQQLAQFSLTFKVRQTGIQRVTYEMLKTAGLDLAGVPSAAITLSNRDQLVPVYVDGNGKFGPGNFIEFYGEALDTLYTDTNVYTLQVSMTPAPRIQSNSAASGNGLVPPTSYPETLLVNNQRGYSTFAPGDDFWYDTLMAVTKTPKSWSFPFQVTGLANPSAPASLELVVWGVSTVPNSPDHHVVVKLNGVPLADEAFNGLVEHTIKVDLPAGTLLEGTNTLQLTLPADKGANSDIVVLDKFSLNYQRLFQAQNGRLTFTSNAKIFNVANLPSQNVIAYRLNDKGFERVGKVVVTAVGGSYTASFAGANETSTYFVTTIDGLYTPLIEATRLKADLNRRADYLIISHPDFISGLAPLVQARQAQGFTVSVVDVNDLYTQYTHGIFDPQAIRQYISYAANNLGTEYVLLVGGDTYDYRGYLATKSISFIPSLYVATSSMATSVPVDALYADLNEDYVPDLAIGRFPVRSTAELSLMVSKTLAYAEKNYGGTAVFASDKQDGNISFKNISVGLSQSLPGSWSVQSVHLDNSSLAAAQKQLIASMNQGAALVTYTGHSSTTAWSSSNLLTTKQASALTNAGRPFMLVQWGCWNTYYTSPVSNGLLQSFLFSGDRGAAAVLGAVTLTEAESEQLLGALLTPRLGTPGMTVGKALLESKLELAQEHPELLDVLLGWGLMGDPALIIQP